MKPIAICQNKKIFDHSTSWTPRFIDFCKDNGIPVSYTHRTVKYCRIPPGYGWKHAYSFSSGRSDRRWSYNGWSAGTGWFPSSPLFSINVRNLPCSSPPLFLLNQDYPNLYIIYNLIIRPSGWWTERQTHAPVFPPPDSSWPAAPYIKVSLILPIWYRMSSKTIPSHKTKRSRLRAS